MARLKTLWLNSDRDCQLLSCGSTAYQRSKPTNPQISFLSQCSIFWPESRNPSGNNYKSHWSILSFPAFHLKRNLLWEPNSFISSHSIKHLHKIIIYFLNALKATRKQYLICLFFIRQMFCNILLWEFWQKIANYCSCSAENHPFTSFCRVSQKENQYPFSLRCQHTAALLHL